MKARVNALGGVQPSEAVDECGAAGACGRLEQLIEPLPRGTDRIELGRHLELACRVDARRRQIHVTNAEHAEALREERAASSLECAQEGGLELSPSVALLVVVARHRGNIDAAGGRTRQATSSSAAGLRVVISKDA